MKRNVFGIGMVVGAIVMFSSSVSAQSIVDNSLLLAQSERNSSRPSSNNNAQDCKEEPQAPGSGGKPTKICRNPKSKNIRIDWCGGIRGICNDTKSSAQAFCKLQGDEYTELLNHGVTPKPISQTISITDGKTCQGRCYPFVWIRCVNPNSIADNKRKKDRSSPNQDNGVNSNSVANNNPKKDRSSPNQTNRSSPSQPFSYPNEKCKGHQAELRAALLRKERLEKSVKNLNKEFDKFQLDAKKDRKAVEAEIANLNGIIQDLQALKLQDELQADKPNIEPSKPKTDSEIGIERLRERRANRNIKRFKKVRRFISRAKKVIPKPLPALAADYLAGKLIDKLEDKAIDIGIKYAQDDIKTRREALVKLEESINTRRTIKEHEEHLLESVTNYVKKIEGWIEKSCNNKCNGRGERCTS